MGLCNSPDVFQGNMHKLFNGLKYVRAYIDDPLIINNKSFEDHINKLDNILSKLKQKDFKVNAEKSFFARSELECLGIRISRQGVKPLPDKVETNKTIVVPTTKKQPREICGQKAEARNNYQKWKPSTYRKSI